MIRRRMYCWAPILIASAFVLIAATDAHAAGVVTNCSDDTDLSNKLVGGGSVTFDCGPATIILSSTKTVDAFTTIDGGGTITLSGDHARRLFIVNLRARLELRNIIIEKGLSKNGNGGAIYNLDTVSITNSLFRNNGTTSAWSGGAIFSNSHLSVNTTVFTDNESGSGGAIHAQSAISQTNISTTSFERNFTTDTGTGTAGFGGALLLTDGATATVNSSSFLRNEARVGGAIDARSESRLFIDGSSINLNKTTSDGGGIDIDVSTAMLSNVAMSGNSGSQGGAFTTFAGEVTLTNVTLSANEAIYGAGYHTFLGTHTFTNVTVSGNTAQSSGGGIYNSRGTMTLTNVTLAGNVGGNGLVGGIVNVGGGPDPTLKLRNVVISRGTSGDNCQFNVAPTSALFNLSDDPTCNFGSGRDNVPLLLGPLAGSPGLMKTHLPGPGSPAIEGGTNSGCPTTDQRGVSRPQGLICDVGAVEVAPATPTPTRTPTSIPTDTATASTTPTQTATPSATRSPSSSPTSTASFTPTQASTATRTATPPATPSATTVPTTVVTPTPTATATRTSTAAQTPTGTRSATATQPATGTPSIATTATVTPTQSAPPTAPAPRCIGDCDDSGQVKINDLVLMVSVALGREPLSACPAADADGSGTTSILEILRAVNNAQKGCPAVQP